MDKLHISLLFVGKASDSSVEKALEFCQANCSDVTFFLGAWGDPLPQAIRDWQGEYIISYLSRWLLPASVLARARTAAINFHPASPDYPGVGCTNMALYEDASEYGATCHHMASRVDTGAIIAVKRFPIFARDDVASLLARTYTYLLGLFYDVVGDIFAGSAMPVSSEQWTRKPLTRKELDRLLVIQPDMTREEIARRVRAMTFGDWKPMIEVQGFVFELKTR